jgi:hypothetical protein
MTSGRSSEALPLYWVQWTSVDGSVDLFGEYKQTDKREHISKRCILRRNKAKVSCVLATGLVAFRVDASVKLKVNINGSVLLVETTVGILNNTRTLPSNACKIYWFSKHLWQFLDHYKNITLDVEQLLRLGCKKNISQLGFIILT